MSSRKPGYLIGVTLLALVMSAPQLLVAFGIGMAAYQSGQWLAPSMSMVGGRSYPNLLTDAALWKDQFVYVNHAHQRSDGIFNWRVLTIDPETGKTADRGLVFSCRSGCQTMAIGDRLWLIGNGETFEVVDDAVQPSGIVNPRFSTVEGMRFLLNGDAAHVETSAQGFAVSTLKHETWGDAGKVVLPVTDRVWKFGETPVNFRRSSWMTCVNQGDLIHVFLQVEGRLLHHVGLKLRQVDSSELLTVGEASPDQPASALKAANTEDEIAGWTLVREKPSIQIMTQLPQQMCGLLVGGQPAAMIIDDVPTGNPVGHLYRFDGAQWSEFATQPFPFGSNQFRAVTCRDGQKSYIVVTTSTGAAQVYAVEAAGIRATPGAAETSSNAAMKIFGGFAFVPAFTLVLGIILGVGIWFLMWRFTKPDYGFGTQTVKLASLGRRGLARLIDLGLIVLTTAGLGWMMTLGFDWLSLAEALNLGVDHPTIPIAARVALILALWLAGFVFSLLMVQSRCGLTPGKWLCGLRTLRTTLQPCGFARSLVREALLAVDACHFLCWTPGILSIAFADCRQRLGDLVADTIVVEARSLTKSLQD